MTAVPTRYTDPGAHELHERYLAAFGGNEISVSVDSIAEDVLGLRNEQRDLREYSGTLIPAGRMIVVNASEAMSGPTSSATGICHASKSAEPQPTYCRSQDMAQDTGRALEREANVFGAELLMPESAVRHLGDVR